MSAMNPNQVIDTYEKILPMTGKMLQAAKNKDWDQLLSLEKDFSALVERLKKTTEATPKMSDAQQQHKAELIKGILANDAEIRNLTEQWMNQIGQFLGSVNYEKKLQKTYGKDLGE